MISHRHSRLRRACLRGEGSGYLPMDPSDTATACASLRRALAACERAVAGRCAESARACDRVRRELKLCESRLPQPPPPPSPPPPLPTAVVMDSNGRAYIRACDGSIQCDDSAVGLAPLPPPPHLPPLSSLSCGVAHCVAIAKTLNEAYSWATAPVGNRFGQLGSSDKPQAQYHVRPQRVALPLDVRRIVGASAGDAHTCL